MTPDVPLAVACWRRENTCLWCSSLWRWFWKAKHRIEEFTVLTCAHQLVCKLIVKPSLGKDFPDCKTTTWLGGALHNKSRSLGLYVTIQVYIFKGIGILDHLFGSGDIASTVFFIGPAHCCNCSSGKREEIQFLEPAQISCAYLHLIRPTTSVNTLISSLKLVNRAHLYTALEKDRLYWGEYCVFISQIYQRLWDRAWQTLLLVLNFHHHPQSLCSLLLSGKTFKNINYSYL